MNVIVPRFLKTAYRKEPISGFILIAGTVNVVMGGVGQRWSLLSFGMMVIITALVMRWLQIQKAKEIAAEETPRYYLPPSSDRQPLPMLMNEKQRR
ncbi:hypothetical protein C7H19_10075 [Aphanothece hegewaldii CCALA 016]|uniref:Uncharacterized protein n=1 Tax=Aphanothece hegewaldii CCALA 016 TaxID=2107694 RepID=A0A2T1LYN9_9CHRO|nr:hypothetical protein [Aphanothece hegewaldii]PSF37505.1 hypothetical protein C7H19_10075 [Aphanothece hegewaldii CCALA 016]